MTTAQDQQSRAECRKAFEFDLIDNWMYVESDFALDENGLYADRELYFAWECAWASWQAARALPAGMEPLCYLRPAAATTPARAWQAWENDGAAQPVYTAAQVQAMGRVPPGWQAVPVEPTAEMMLHNSGCQHHAHDDAGCSARQVRRKVWAHMLAAAPRPPAAPTTEPQAPTTGAGSATTGAAQERSPLPARPLRSPECWCECCDTVANSGWRSRMSLCPKCGDKRCPRAYHHDSDCFASPKEPAP